ncbi:MAG: recombinase family protein [Candidatus Taylorbacteria bacterium]
MQTKNCAVYTRVSTDMQAEKEFSSCEAQEQKIRSFIASQNNWQVFKIYNDAGFSGATLQRPKIQELLSDLKKEKIDVVLVYKIDRLTRSPKDFYQLIELFEQAKIDFISITERFDTSTPAGRLLRNIMLTFSQFERELTSERTRDKMLERAKKGLCNGGFTPYGYSRENKKIVVNPKEAKEIKSIFETYVETGSLAETYKNLKKQGIKSKYGKNFSKTIIAYLLRNPVYIGKVKHNSEIYQGIHEPIISEEIFALAQKIHKEKLKNFRVYKNFLFGGLIKCESCGSSMSASFSNKHTNGKFNRRYYYYRCTSTTKFDWQTCPVKQVSAERLENFCLENLERILVDKNYIENLVFRLNNDTNAGHREGHELTDECSKFSAENLTRTLKFFVDGIKKTKGIERNLFAKKFLSNIFYSPETIKFRFILPQNGGEAAANASPAPPQAGLGERTLSSGNFEFVPNEIAAGLGFEPR